MDLKATLSKLDDILAPAPAPKLVTMTTAQFEAHVTDQIEKAKKDAEEEDKKKGAKKAKKRLEILRAQVAHVAKTDFGMGAPGIFGDNGSPIPMYEEKDITRFAEMSEVEMAIPLAGGPGMADGASFAQPGSAQGFADAGAGGGGGGPAGGAALPAIGGTAGTGPTSWAAPGGQSDFAKAFDSLKKTIDEAAGTAPAAPAAPVTPAAAPSFDWPKDLAATEEVVGKEAVTKRAPESWGRDGATASK